MKFAVLAVLMCVVATQARPEATYTDKWDHINVEEVMGSERLLNGYVDCLLDKGRCTPDAKALKETLPDALEHKCSSCTEKQKTSSDKVLKFLINKRDDLWQQLASKYDPKNIYQQRYKEDIESAKDKA